MMMGGNLEVRGDQDLMAKFIPILRSLFPWDCLHVKASLCSALPLFGTSMLGEVDFLVSKQLLGKQKLP